MSAKNQLDVHRTNLERIMNMSAKARRRKDQHQAALSSQEQTRELLLDAAASGRSAYPASCTVLTPRERDVLRLLAEGYSSKQIADKLNISVNTVNNHRAAIFIKLHVHSVAGALKWYWQTSARS